MNTLDPLIDAYLRGRIDRGEISQQTGRDARWRLLAFSKAFGRRPIDQLGPRAIDRWMGTIAHHAPSTRRERLSTVRGFCRWLTDEGHISSDPTTHVKPIRQPRRTPVTLTEGEVARLLTAAPDERARAILWLMVGCGCRRVEVSRLDVEDYTPGPRATLRLVGKAGHERIIAAPAEVCAALDAYLDVRGRVAGPLITARDHRTRLAPHTIGVYVNRWMRAAGVKRRAYDGRSAHGLRRTAASDVLDRSGNLQAVQAMLGHRSLHTTATHYLRPVALDAMAQAMSGRDYTEPAALPHLEVVTTDPPLAA